MQQLMTTREVAEYLRLKERKVYELVRTGAVPCTRVTGKWLFPRALIDRWLLEHGEGGAREMRPAPAQVVAGSHDPLLEWAVQASGCGLALLFGGSLDGLSRFARDEAVVAGMHIPDPQGAEDNVGAVREAGTGREPVLIEWARRAQGLMVAPGNPLGISGLGDLVTTGARLIDRQPGAGSRLRLDFLLEEAGIARADLAIVEEPAINENDVARIAYRAYRKYKRPFSAIPEVSRAARTRSLTPVAARSCPNSVRSRPVAANRTAKPIHFADVGLSRNERRRAAPGRSAA